MRVVLRDLNLASFEELESLTYPQYLAVMAAACSSFLDLYLGSIPSVDTPTEDGAELLRRSARVVIDAAEAGLITEDDAARAVPLVFEWDSLIKYEPEPNVGLANAYLVSESLVNEICGNWPRYAAAGRVGYALSGSSPVPPETPRVFSLMFDRKAEVEEEYLGVQMLRRLRAVIHMVKTEHLADADSTRRLYEALRPPASDQHR